MKILPTLVVTALSLGTLLACSSPDDSPDAGSTGAGARAVPAADVVSAVHTDATLSAKLPAAIRADRVLTFGTTLNPGTAALPYSGTVGGRNVGLHADLAAAVAKVLGVRARLSNGTFATIVPAVQGGRYDVGLANLGVTREREKVVDFATYLTDGQSFLAGRGTDVRRVRTLTDLCGLTVATSPGTTFQQILGKGKDDCAGKGKKPYRVQYFSTSAPILLGLANGKVDVEFGPTLSLKYDAAHITGTRFLGQISATPVGFVTAKGSALAPLLRDAVNALIRSGDYRRILTKWGIAGSAVASSAFNPAPTL